MNLEKYRDQIYSCLRCAFCFDDFTEPQKSICPAYGTYGFDSYGARGKIVIARGLLDGTLNYNDEITKRVYACTECSACQEQCFKHLDLLEIYAAMKEDLAERDLLPSGVNELLKVMEEFGNPYRQPPEKRLAWAPGKSRVDKKAKVLLFVGCTSAYLRRGMARAAYRILDALDIDFTLLGDEHCCGHPYVTVGKMEEAKRVTTENVAMIEGLGVEKVVFTCPGCLRTFKVDTPKLTGRPLPFEVLHLTEFVSQYLSEHPVRLQRSSRIVTYHDPCNLGRGLGVYEPPRQVIKAVPGTRLVEMPRNREHSFCCGNGAYVRYDYEELSVKSELDRFTEAEQTGADTVLSACPACQTGFLDARRRAKSQIEVLDVLELLAQAL